MPKDFNELGYVLPEGTPKEYSDRAIAILKDLLDSDPSTAVYVMEPSAVLLFAGLRAQSPYHELGSNITEVKKQKLNLLLARYDIYTYYDRMHYDNKNKNVFSLISKTGLEEVASRYRFFNKKWILPYDYTSSTALLEWLNAIEYRVAGYMQSGDLPEEWLRSYWNPSTLCFGVLLGYPGKAISSCLWDLINNSDDKPKITWIMISDGSPYYGAHVGFDVHAELAMDDQIESLKKLWADTLELVYKALPLATLLKEKEFSQAYQQLKESNGEI